MKDIEMHEKKIKNLLKKSGKDRFRYFVRKVADFELVWGLFADGWAVTSTADGQNAIPFWPEKELADICAEGVWSDYNSQQIELERFISKWLLGMEKDDVLAAIFPTPKDKGVIVQPKLLLFSLEEELEQYE